MEKNILSVRETEQKDIEHIADYWFTSEPAYLEGMGVDIGKMPAREDFIAMLNLQITQPYELKKAYALIWEVDNLPIGHCNVNPLTYGDHAFMHLHIWKNEYRNKGLGASLVKMSIPLFFKNLNLKKLYCEPYTLNPSPNKVMEKTGFIFAEEYITTPGASTFQQTVKRWYMDNPE